MRYFVQISLRVYQQVGSLGEILIEQAIGALIGATLPRTLRIAEVNIDVGRQGKPPLSREFLAPVPSQGLIQLLGSVFARLMSAETTVCVSLFATFANIM